VFDAQDVHLFLIPPGSSYRAHIVHAPLPWSDGSVFLGQLQCYESQPLDTQRCNFCYQVGVF